MGQYAMDLVHPYRLIFVVVDEKIAIVEIQEIIDYHRLLIIIEEEFKMIQKESKHTMAIPPGMTIEELLEDRHISQKEFAVRMNLSEKHVSQLIKGDVPLSFDVAERLEKVLNVPAAFWNNLEALYQEKLIKVKKENELAGEINFATPFNYDKLAKLGMVEPTFDTNERITNLHRFFEVTTLKAVFDDQLMPIACRHLAKTEQDQHALYTLVQYAKLEAREYDVTSYSIKALKKIIPQLRDLTNCNYVEMAGSLYELLESCGIALIRMPPLGALSVKGFTFLDGKKIVIGIIGDSMYSDVFWFSLFHELSHVLMNHLKPRYSITEIDEIEADTMARNLLISDEAWQEFLHNNSITEAGILSFASNQGISPSIVIGRLEHDNIINTNLFKHLRTQYHMLH